MLRAYYIEVSASTAIGLSLTWVLIGDWTSNCNYGDTNKVPSVLISGTAAGMFAGFGLVHLAAASDFRASLRMLAVMDVCVSFLLFFRDGNCIFAGKKKPEDWKFSSPGSITLTQREITASTRWSERGLIPGAFTIFLISAIRLEATVILQKTRGMGRSSGSRPAGNKPTVL
jgi:hypothetical protein